LFAVEVSDQIMIAHSFRGAVFGPAQELHGATFVVRAAFIAEQLDPNGIVVDIGLATDTTTEFLTKYIFDQLADAARAARLGRDGRELKAIRITIAESPTALAWYEAPLW
jgi:6-pyruvoyl-tetrahydropterin synthase